MRNLLFILAILLSGCTAKEEIKLEATERGDQIAFQEMRGDTVVIKGNPPAVLNSDETHSYKWTLTQNRIKVGEYEAPEETPYLLAIIKPGIYTVIRETKYFSDSKLTGRSKSNEVKFTYGYLTQNE